MTGKLVTRRVVIYEAIAFMIVFAFLWADELFDLPHAVFGTVATPINWSESIIETSFVAILGIAVTLLSRHYLLQIKQLEGIVPVCAVCKKIRDGKTWVPFEQYVKQHSAAEFSHGLCPECARPYYQELNESKQDSPAPHE